MTCLIGSSYRYRDGCWYKPEPSYRHWTGQFNIFTLRTSCVAVINYKICHVCLASETREDLYYDYHLSKAQRNSGNQVQLVLLSRATGSVSSGNLSCRPLTSLAVKRAKLQATILLPLETRKVARGDTVILSPKHRHQRSVASYSTDNRCTSRPIIAGICSDPSSQQSPRLPLPIQTLIY